jgi:plastocyanin
MSPSLHRALAAMVAAAILAAYGSPRAESRRDVSGLVRLAGRPAPDAVVWLEHVRLSGAPRQTAVLDQRNLTFSPRVLAISVGTAVSMPNSDRVFHNVFSFRDGKRFDLGLYPVGLSKTVVFDRAGVSRVFCNIHPNMAAYVVAVDSDVFAVSDKVGAFTLTRVPDGPQTYRVWRAGAEIASGQLAGDAGQRVEIDLR